VKNFETSEELDADVISSMNCLGCFKDRDKLIKSLLQQEWVGRPTIVIFFFFYLRFKISKHSDTDLENMVPPWMLEERCLDVVTTSYR